MTHLVDLSTFHHTTHHLKSWAYCEVNAPGETDVQMDIDHQRAGRRVDQ